MIIIVIFLFINVVNSFIPASRYGHTATLVGKKIYFIGGSSAAPWNTYPLRKDFFYLDVSRSFNTTDPSLIPWTDLSSIPGTPASESPSVTLGGLNNDLIILFGGAMDGNSSGLPLVFTFNPLENLWNTPNMLGNMPPRHARARGVSDSGKMYSFSGQQYVATGFNGSKFDVEMDIIDTIRLSYSLGSTTNAPTARDGYGCLMLPNGIILYMGGWDPLQGLFNSLQDVINKLNLMIFHLII